CDYTKVLELNLRDVQPSIAGPKRPQDRIALPELKRKFTELFQAPVQQNGYNKQPQDFARRFPIQLGNGGPAQETFGGGGQQASETAPQARGNDVTAKNTSALTELEMMNNRPTPDVLEKPASSRGTERTDLGHGDVVIAAITSC